MKFLKIVSINLIILLCLASMLEVFARLTFPEFKNHIFSNSKSMNVQYHDGNFHGYQIRKPSAKPHSAKKAPLVVVIGDSISGGFGTAYEDIWWEKLRRLLEVSGKNIEIISIGAYGSSIGDAVNAVYEIAEEKDLVVSKIIYQFNYNDIMPFQKADLQNIKSTNIVGTDLFASIARWRYKYANHSVFLRTMQHYAGRVIRKTSGTCEDRYMHALGPYTWSFGSVSRIDESIDYWDAFNVHIKNMYEAAQGIDAEFEIFISPILYDIDVNGAHPHFNYLNYDFSCATINPKQKIQSLALKIGIKVYDPAPEMRRSLEARIDEGNFSPYFFTADDNHFTPLAGTYAAEVIAREWSDRIDKK